MLAFRYAIGLQTTASTIYYRVSMPSGLLLLGSVPQASKSSTLNTQPLYLAAYVLFTQIGVYVATGTQDVGDVSFEDGTSSLPNLPRWGSLEMSMCHPRNTCHPYLGSSGGDAELLELDASLQEEAFY